MSKSIQIELDDSVYKKFVSIVKKQGSKPEDEIIKAIQEYILRRKEYIRDTFFKIGKAGRSGWGNLAKSHDKYLYESAK